MIDQETNTIERYLIGIKESVNNKYFAKGIDFFMENADTFTVNDVKTGELFEQVKMKACYRNATLAAARYNYAYYEGWFVSELGIPIAHAFNVDRSRRAKKRLVDLTAQCIDAKGLLYMGVEIPLNFILAMNEKHGYSGQFLPHYIGEKLGYEFPLFL